MRTINTKFWDDSYIITLDPHEKLLFLYLLTNPLTNICGAYEITTKRIGFDTGLADSLLENILKKFEDDRKITHKEGWVVIHNFIKNQSLNPKVIAGIKDGLNITPLWVKNSLSIDLDSLSHSNSNSNLNSNLNSNSNFESGNTPAQKARKFFNDQAEFMRVLTELIKLGIPEISAKQELNRFVSYWTELNKSGTKERWELEKTFDVGRRLNTWFSRIQDFNKNNKSNKTLIL